jgi:hypothetical protein
MISSVSSTYLPSPLSRTVGVELSPSSTSNQNLPTDSLATIGAANSYVSKLNPSVVEGLELRAGRGYIDTAGAILEFTALVAPQHLPGAVVGYGVLWLGELHQFKVTLSRRSIGSKGVIDASPVKWF